MSEWPPENPNAERVVYDGTILDYDRLLSDESYFTSMSPKIVEQLKEVGFIILEVDENEGDSIYKANQATRLFFENNSDTEKWRCSLHTEGVGFSYFGGKCTRQAYTVNLPSKGQPFPWPESPDNFQDEITSYFNFLQKVGSTVLSSVELGMKEPKESLTKYLDLPEDKLPYTSSILFARYYQSERIFTDEASRKEADKEKLTSAQKFWPKDHTREHTDSGLLTIKPLSEIAALQIMRWTDKQWVDAEVHTRAKNKIPLVVLVGEELAYLTKGYFKAAIHRVGFIEADTRISLPFQLRGNRNKFTNLQKHNPNLKLIAISLH
eukprot:TRINITY_DN2589_c0_g1_i1.p1 TRINITY_DN2589_c0_g1~~TRINITY_DN2589_c0_g1_i1.p1  ORF type:complete len:322 (+),score=49.78 TRINITY_DN2589_c0_g1_i1:48-1013(+)